jgi:hypothetical protein
LAPWLLRAKTTFRQNGKELVATTNAKSPTNAQMTRERRNRKHIQITNEAMRIRQHV